MISSTAQSRPSTKRPRVRTGCITCRIRKVKCDEIKPACKRCTDTGRKCDGYVNINPSRKPDPPLVSSRSSPSSSLVRTCSPQADIPLLSATLPAIELHWISYFSLHTGPSLSGFADGEFWSQTLPQLCFTEPAIRHAVLAVASYHAQFGSYTTERVIPSAARLVSIKHYTKAISCLQQCLAQGTGNAEIPLICCLLFICLECFEGNRVLVLDHLRSGLSILQSEQSYSPSSPFSIKPKLNNIFRRLDAQSTMWGRPTCPQLEELVDQLKALDTSITDVSTAQRTLDSLVWLSLNFGHLVSRDSCHSCGSPNETIRCPYTLQQRLQERLMRWNHDFSELEKAHRDRHGFVTAARLLRIHHAATFVYLSTCLDTYEQYYEAFMPEFTTIVRLATEIIDSSLQESATESLSFSLEAVFILPLYLTALKCRDKVIRHKAIHLLEAQSGLEGLCVSKIHARVARRVVEIEESLELPCTMPAATLEPLSLNGANKQFWVHPHEINRDDDGTSRSACVTLLATFDGHTDSPSMVWQEDIVF
ncbi:hypothetical protein K461DRAFT_268211 [Myriangium duriaei CBS 260.36]|uniref:Zn(2)-C6 fungal-type domain-containing protein n=1 Tax=Myriangium duriaei CBS 260.36 TaxID=1168546 RepID=A0A9P4J085_9PEZI|nr:hypothetical protein K461DRAFT_268211 [Myriangium duriaei CBS 260.36]